MLILGRKEGQQFVINGNIFVTVIDIRRKDGSVRIGIEAPQDVTVHRREVQDKIDSGKGYDR